MEDPGSFRSGLLDWDQGSRIRLIEEQRRPAREGSGAGGGVNSKGHRALLLSKTKLDPFARLSLKSKTYFPQCLATFRLVWAKNGFPRPFSIRRMRFLTLQNRGIVDERKSGELSIFEMIPWCALQLLF